MNMHIYEPLIFFFFYKGAKTAQRGKDSRVRRRTSRHASQRVQELTPSGQVKPKCVKPLEENVGGEICYVHLTPETQSVQESSDELDFINTENISSAKGTVERRE